MYDIYQVMEQNNQIALQTMMRGYAVAEVQTPQPGAWPLAVLADKLAVRLPLLTEIMTCLENTDTVKEFISLCRMLLPEYEKEIMSEPRSRRVYKFCYLYGKKYYPLPANTDCGVGDLLEGMPVELMGMSYTAYHDLDMRSGYLLLLSLVIYPYEGDERDLEDDDVPFDPFNPTKWKPSRDDIRWLKNLISNLQDGGRWIAPMGFTITKIDNRTLELIQAENNPDVEEVVRRTVLIAQKEGIKVNVKIGRTAEEKMISGARIPLLDIVKNIVGPDLVSRIPPDGWLPQELHSMTDKTPYQGVGDFADWVCSNTGCVMLDSNYENCNYIEGYGEPIFKWTKNNVEVLTAQWPKVKEIRTKIDHIVEWLEADQINNFEELLEFLKKHYPEVSNVNVTHRQYDHWDHLCDLDQKGDDEEDEWG